MERFWGVFWKVFGVALALALIAGIIAGLIVRSAGLTYAVTQKAIAVGLGLCGLIGLVVVPAEMFLESRMKSGGTNDAAE
jgi:hypothetical protein